MAMPPQEAQHVAPDDRQALAKGALAATAAIIEHRKHRGDSSDFLDEARAIMRRHMPGDKASDFERTVFRALFEPPPLSA